MDIRKVEEEDGEDSRVGNTHDTEALGEEAGACNSFEDRCIGVVEDCTDAAPVLQSPF